VPALAFNAPQPIKHNDFFRLNGTADDTMPVTLPTQTPAAGTAAPAPGPQSGAAVPTPESGTPVPAPGSTTGGATPSRGPLLRITEALNIGLLQSPRVAAARAQLEISKALYAAATQLPNPVLGLDNGYIAEQTYRTGIQNTFDPPWKIAFRLLAAKRQVKQTKLEILNTLWLFRNDLRRTYTELVVAQESYSTLSALAQLSQELLDVAQKRFSVGDVPELDVLKARLALSHAQIDAEQGRRRMARAKQQLNVMIGAQLNREYSVPALPLFKLHAEKSELLPDFSAPVPRLKDLLEEAMSNRLELKITKQQIVVAQAQLYNAIGNILPDPIIATGNSATGNPPSGPKMLGFYMIMNFELPVLTFSQGDIVRLKATIRQLYHQYHAQENQITGEVAGAYNNLMAARAQIRVYQEHVLADSQEVAQLARLSYQVGQSDITATLAALEANEQTRNQYLSAVTAYQQAFTDLEQAIGEPLQ
jgi:cobalt-zinc-cadmium efflux system outer membrane protein